MEQEDAIAVELVRRDLDRAASERYKGYVIRSKLKAVPNEAVKCKTDVRKKEARRFSHRYIESAKSPVGHVLRSRREIGVAFWVDISRLF